MSLDNTRVPIQSHKKGSSAATETQWDAGQKNVLGWPRRKIKIGHVQADLIREIKFLSLLKHEISISFMTESR